MKTIKLLFFTLLISLPVNAQITKGYWLVGGSGAFNSSKVKDVEGSIITSGIGINITPNLGYFFFDNFAGGIQIYLGYGRPSGGNSNFGYGAKPFIRYYFLNSEKLINLLAEVSYGYNINKTSGQKAYYGRSYNFKGGTAIFLNNCVAIEITANYELSYLEINKYNYKDFSIGIGFQFHLEKK